MPNTILRLPAVKAATGLSRSSIYERINPKSARYDPAFPKPVAIGLRAVGWVDSEIQAYIARQIASSRKSAA